MLGSKRLSLIPTSWRTLPKAFPKSATLRQVVTELLHGGGLSWPGGNLEHEYRETHQSPSRISCCFVGCVIQVPPHHSPKAVGIPPKKPQHYHYHPLATKEAQATVLQSPPGVKCPLPLGAQIRHLSGRPRRSYARSGRCRGPTRRNHSTRPLGDQPAPGGAPSRNGRCGAG